MSGIKYYQLGKGEEMPDEFCAVRDVGGEPSDYVFYVPEAENDKLRNLLLDCWDLSHLMHESMAARFYELGLIDDGEARELGVEVEP